METKVQYKFQIEDTKKFNSLLKAQGVELSKPTKHAYTYFEVSGKSDPAFSVLRLKISGKNSSVDMKIRNDQTGEWEHFESGIDDPEQIKSIFQALDNKPIFTFHKERETYKNDFIRIDVDTTKELGTFLEVKFLLSDKIKAESFLKKLGVDVTHPDKRSVIEIYREKYKKN